MKQIVTLIPVCVNEAILGWLLIAFVTIPKIQICSRFGLKFPSTAGLAGYAEEAFGPWGRYSVSYPVGGSFRTSCR
jgi:amino acid transporter